MYGYKNNLNSMYTNKNVQIFKHTIYLELKQENLFPNLKVVTIKWCIFLIHLKLIFQEYIVDAKNFSQTDVNEGRVLYEHRRPFSNLTAFDVISLEAMTDYAQRSLDLVLNVRISVTAMIPGK